MDALSDQLRVRGLTERFTVEPTLIRQRLAVVAMRVETLLSAIAITQSPDHPLWSERHANAGHAALILRDLIAVISRKGWRVSKRQAIQRGRNNPYRIIAYLWQDRLRASCAEKNDTMAPPYQINLPSTAHRCDRTRI